MPLHDRMPMLHITGGRPLSGTVELSGAKNSASKLIVAALLSEDRIALRNVPRQQETDIAREIVELLGVSFVWTGDHAVEIHAADLSGTSVVGLSRKNRLSILTLAPLLHRTGEAYVPKVGGDDIGPRPVNFHIDILRAMGAELQETADGYHAIVKGRLQGALISLPYPSVGATETALFAGVRAKGRTVIRNAAGEPEVKQLIMFLQNMGAKIQIDSGRTIEIIGVEKLGGATATVIPDRLEAASFACMALGTGGDVFVKGARQDHLMTFLNAVRKIGGTFEVQEDGIRFFIEQGTPLTSLELETDTHPGFASDWQQPFVVVLTQAHGMSVVHETVYEDRFGYTETLKKMGADIALSTNCLGEIPCRYRGGNFRHSAVINGPTVLHASDVVIPDIRAGLAFVVAALTANGTSTLSGLEHLDRGYERLEEKLKGIGAQIERRVD